MKKLFAIMLLLFIFSIAAFYYVIHDGDFTKWSHTTMEHDYLKNGKVYYFGYDFSWEGIGKPTLEKVELIKKDGTLVTKDDNDFKIEPYISKTSRIGLLDEEAVLNEFQEDLVEVKGHQVSKNFYLVLAVQYNGSNPENDIHLLRITYKQLGVTQHREILFDDGVISDPHDE